MPELPEIEALVLRLTPRLQGQTLLSLVVHRPLVLRNLLPSPEAETILVGRRVTALQRRGKLFMVGFGDLWLVTHFMLAGRLTWPQPGDQAKSRDYYTLGFSDGFAMRYNDPRSMGKTYLTRDLQNVPGFSAMAPDALAEDLTSDAFLQRLKRHPGEIKGVLTHERLVCGIGNAYADEILFAAGIYPFSRCSRLTLDEKARLYSAMRDVLRGRVAYLLQHWPLEMDLHWREGLQIHRRAGEPCPRCGTPISEINVGKRPTNFCRSCQPGLLIRN
ncbi:MAG: DNA-formamidopyrimidine glycosylase family protein [Anaerolineae bacterium]